MTLMAHATTYHNLAFSHCGWSSRDIASRTLGIFIAGSNAEHTFLQTNTALPFLQRLFQSLPHFGRDLLERLLWYPWLNTKVGRETSTRFFSPFRHEVEQGCWLYVRSVYSWKNSRNRGGGLELCAELAARQNTDESRE